MVQKQQQTTQTGARELHQSEGNFEIIGRSRGASSWAITQSMTPAITHMKFSIENTCNLTNSIA